MLFFRHVTIFFNQIVLVTDILLCFHCNSQKQLVKRVLITSAKLIAKKNEEIHDRDTKYYIENICHQFPD